MYKINLRWYNDTILNFMDYSDETSISKRENCKFFKSSV